MKTLPHIGRVFLSMRLKFFKRSEEKFFSRIVPDKTKSYSGSYGTNCRISGDE